MFLLYSSFFPFPSGTKGKKKKKSSAITEIERSPSFWRAAKVKADTVHNCCMMHA